MNIDLSAYDFIDFGSSRGGCIDFAIKKLGGKRGLGIELHKKRADDLNKKGYPCINADVTTLNLPKKSVRFVTMSHFLEHLHNIPEVLYVIKLAARTTTDFVFIEGPTFDFDDYLKSKGFKFFWCDWTGHTLPMTTGLLKEIFKKLKLSNYTLLVEKRYITNSLSPDIHPLNSPKNQHAYNIAKHPLKETIKFDAKIFRSFIFFIWLKKEIVNRKQLLQSRTKFHVIEDVCLSK